MLALQTFSRLADEQSGTDMAVSADSLTGGLLDKILAAGSRGKGQNDLLLWLGLLRIGSTVSTSLRRDVEMDRILGLLFRDILAGRLGRRVAEALLAARMLAFGTSLVGAKGGETAMAVAANSHTDGLLDSLNLTVAGGTGNPFTWFQGQAIFGKQDTSLVLLERAIFEDLGSVCSHGGGRLGS